MSTQATAAHQARPTAAAIAAAAPTISIGALAWYSPQSGWLVPSWNSGLLKAYAASTTSIMALIPASLARWCGPVTPTPARLTAHAVQPALTATSAKATGPIAPVGPE